MSGVVLSPVPDKVGAGARPALQKGAVLTAGALAIANMAAVLARNLPGLRDRQAGIIGGSRRNIGAP